MSLKIYFPFLLALLAGCSSRHHSAISLNPDIVEQKYVHKYGLVVPPEDWVGRGENGKIIASMKSGVVVTKNYCRGKLEGEATYSFPHCDAIECVEYYAKGKLEKKITNYYCGNPKEEVQYLPRGERVTAWYDSGHPKSIEEYEDSSLVYAEYYSPTSALESQVANGSGLRTNRDEYGELISSETLEKGKVVQKTLFYPNGSPKEFTPYQNSLVEGERKTFLPAGEPSTVERWEHGVQQGLTVVFQNGEKYAEVPYENGCKRGIEKRFRNGKTVVEEISWCDNVRHGPSYAYIGDAVKTDYYFQGKEVTKGQFEILMNPHS